MPTFAATSKEDWKKQTGPAKIELTEDGETKIRVSDLKDYSLTDTMECGQCFWYELISKTAELTEYMTVVGTHLITVGQDSCGDLIFSGVTEEEFTEVCIPYFALDTDYDQIRADIIKRSDSEWLHRAAECARGVRILKQDPWEALFSFIVSQNNNIPRIRKIIRRLSAEYGVNLCLQKGIGKCPLGKIDGTPCEEFCKECGSCYTFPAAGDVVKRPEGLLTSNPGFRYKYLCDAAEKVDTGAVSLDMIAAARSYTHTVSELCRIKGVGEKVASCTALFGFGNLEAFPIDVWMKRAIDEYFDGKLDPNTLGRYAGVAQQYIFHYIRNLSAQQQ